MPIFVLYAYRHLCFFLAVRKKIITMKKLITIITTTLLFSLNTFGQLKDTTIEKGRIYLRKEAGINKTYQFTNLSVVNEEVSFTQNNQKINLNLSKVREIDAITNKDQRWLFTIVAGGASLLTSSYMINRRVKQCNADPDCTTNFKPVYAVGFGMTIGSGLVGYLIGKKMKKTKVVYFKP